MFKFDKRYLNAQSYLNQFWPSDPRSSSVWVENQWLLQCYVECATYLKNHGPQNINALEISSGPTLAPLIPFTKVVSNIQLSDFDRGNRALLLNSDIGYWEKYVEEVIKMEDSTPTSSKIFQRLRTLDKLRHKNKIAKVNIKRYTKQIFNPPVDYKNFNLIIVHFVIDSITESRKSYFELLTKTIQKIFDNGDFLLMSALIECTKWDDGEKFYPSPNIKLSEIIEHLKSLRVETLYKNEIKHNSAIGHNGGFGVILGQKS